MLPAEFEVRRSPQGTYQIIKGSPPNSRDTAREEEEPPPDYGFQADTFCLTPLPVGLPPCSPYPGPASAPYQRRPRLSPWANFIR